MTGKLVRTWLQRLQAADTDDNRGADPTLGECMRVGVTVSLYEGNIS